MIRGINKQDIFLDTQDKYKFMKEMKRTKEKFDYELYSYCLMPNHVHLEIKVNEDGIEKIMHSLQISYSKYFNLKYERVGHLFQNRYLSKTIEYEESVLGVMKYIHQNPEKAGIEKTEKYFWSSYQEYIWGKGITDKEFIFKLLTRDKGKELEEFKKFNKFNNQKYLLNFDETKKYGWNKKISDEQLVKIIQEIIEDNNIYKILNYKKTIRDKYLSDIKEKTGVSNQQIARIFGISKKTLERIS